MRVGIIGAGNIGGTLTRRLRALGHEVQVANSRGPQTLASLAAATGAVAVDVGRAARSAEVLVVAIPEGRVPDLPAGVLDGLAPDGVVVDTGNYYPQRDGRIAEIEDGMPESVWVGAQLGVPVVKAFNGIYAQSLGSRGRPPGTPGRFALPVAGDGDQAKAVVLGLVEALGFDAVDAGPLAESWRQQPGTPSYGAELSPGDLRTALADASPDRPAEFRAR